MTALPYHPHRRDCGCITNAAGTMIVSFYAFCFHAALFDRAKYLRRRRKAA